MAYALVIAGGKGERLRPLTEDRPKAMVELNGRPLIDYHIEWLRNEGVTDAILLCGYRAEVLQDYCGDGDRWGLRIQYNLEQQPLGRGGALKAGFALVPDAEQLFIATNGDVLTNQSLSPMISFHNENNAAATIMVTPLISSYGIIDVKRDGSVGSFREKPRLPYWINAGVYVLSREFFNLLPDVGDHETSTFPQLASENRLYAYKSKAFWKSVDTAKDLSEAVNAIEQWRQPSAVAKA
jgi:NDP-sugar pyrophosphorylase family protein